MELSQTSLAILLLVGVPAGAVLNLAYALTDIRAIPDGFLKKLLCNVKDFVFMLIAGLMAVLIVYFVNQGEFRYMVLVGMMCGFAVSHFAFEKVIVRARDALMRAIAVPLSWIWRITLGKLLAKSRGRARIKQTQTRMQQLTQIASNGFEN